MQHTKALIIKFIMISIVYAIILPFVANTNLANTLITSAVTTVLLYLVGDLFVLPSTGNVTASVVDAVTSAVIVWGMQFVLPGMYVPFTGALISGLIVGVVEFIFHKYLLANVISKQTI